MMLTLALTIIVDFSCGNAEKTYGQTEPIGCIIAALLGIGVSTCTVYLGRHYYIAR